MAELSLGNLHRRISCTNNAAPDAGHTYPALTACIKATLETGMRKGEILGLQWQDVREGLGEIHLPGRITKTGVPRAAVITPTIAAVLDMLKTAQRTARELKPEDDLPGDCHPFGNEIGERIGNIQTAWRLTCRRAGILGLHFHDLRREAGSRLHETPGVSLTDVRDYLGHRDVGQTNKYLATSTQRLRAALVKRDESRTNLAHASVEQTEADQITAVPH